MKQAQVFALLSGVVVMMWSLTVLAPSAAAQGSGFKVLHNFEKTSTDARNLRSPLVFDSAGNLYGASAGGKFGYGRVFQLTRDTEGLWKEHVVYDFANGDDGSYPSFLIVDAAGQIYGTTNEGGLYGGGVVFTLTRSTSGKWTEQVLHSFAGAPDDGASPMGALVFDKTGNLYGATAAGGVNTWGTVFELLPQEDGTWKKAILHSFDRGAYPNYGLSIDRNGNLYGTTTQSVFKLTSDDRNEWSFTTLHEFPDDLPRSGVISDPDGTLFGTTLKGGVDNFGTVFEISATGSYKLLYSFGVWTNGGYSPEGGLVFGPSGTLYGTTSQGGGYHPYGDPYGAGKIFQLIPPSYRGGTWRRKTLHVFGGRNLNGYQGSDGISPSASLILDAVGNLYGTTYNGGSNNGGYEFGFRGGGTAFELELH